MDVFAALALSTEPPLKSVIDGAAYKDNVALLSPTVWRQIIGVAFYNIVIILIVMFFGRMAANLPEYDRSVGTLVPMPTGIESRVGNYT
jgi:Ca2+-transporting ATPase